MRLAESVFGANKFSLQYFKLDFIPSEPESTSIQVKTSSFV